MFIMLDGIDGSGKSTIIEAWTEHFADQGKKIFSIKKFWQENNRHPLPNEVENFDVIVSAEPTYVWIGRAIREEMVRAGTNYSSRAIANAFALDRLVLYKRLLVPLLAQNKIIIQDRGVSTSLCYQPLQYSDLTISEVANIEGNAFTLAHAPNHLVIIDVDPKIALERIAIRHEKQDNAIFEKQDFLERAQAGFLNNEFQSLFTTHGSQVHILSSDATIDIMKKKAIDWLKNINL